MGIIKAPLEKGEKSLHRSILCPPVYGIAISVSCLLLVAPSLSHGDAQEVFQTRRLGVVLIFARHNKSTSVGTGFVADQRGRVLTNYHVVNGATSIEVHVLQRDESVRKFQGVQLIAADRQGDVALLELTGQGVEQLHPLPLFRGDQLRVGEEVYAIGNPAIGDQILSHTITAGILSSTSRKIDGRDFIQHSAAINPGNSGGPLLDKTGRVIGINTLKAAQGEQLGFAVPINKAIPEELIKRFPVNSPRAESPALSISLPKIPTLPERPYREYQLVQEKVYPLGSDCSRSLFLLEQGLWLGLSPAGIDLVVVASGQHKQATLQAPVDVFYDPTTKQIVVLAEEGRLVQLLDLELNPVRRVELKDRYQRVWGWTAKHLLASAGTSRLMQIDRATGLDSLFIDEVTPAEILVLKPGDQFIILESTGRLLRIGQVDKSWTTIDRSNTAATQQPVLLAAGTDGLWANDQLVYRMNFQPPYLRRSVGALAISSDGGWVINRSGVLDLRSGRAVAAPSSTQDIVTAAFLPDETAFWAHLGASKRLVLFRFGESHGLTPAPLSKAQFKEFKASPPRLIRSVELPK
jgi:V8-like Glu-specific endopeptidase